MCSHLVVLWADVIQHVHNTKHVAVLSHGAFYVISIFDPKGVRLSPRDLEK